MGIVNNNSNHSQCPYHPETQIYPVYKTYIEPGGSGICAGCLFFEAPMDPSTVAASPPTQEENVLPHNRDVYLAFRNVQLFQKRKNQKMNATRIKIAINRRRDREDVKKLLNQHSSEALCIVVKDLLRCGVFASANEAKTLFPDLFPDMPIDGQNGEDLPAEVETGSNGLQPAVPEPEQLEEDGRTEEGAKDTDGIQLCPLYTLSTNCVCVTAGKP